MATSFFFFFFFNDTATTEIYTLSLHDALPISASAGARSSASPAIHKTSASCSRPVRAASSSAVDQGTSDLASRSEEHTSELQSRLHLVCRLLLEKKKKKKHYVLHTQTNWTNTR